jgi:UDP-glucose 4-epimerase
LDDIGGIRNLLELSRDYRVKKLIYASSSEVYGEQIADELREEDIPKVIMPYAVVKLVGETYCKTYWQEYGVDTTALRFFNVYGPRQDGSGYGFVVSIFIEQALHNKDLTVFGDGLMTRSFVYVDDNVESALRAVFSKNTSGECINIGSDNVTTIGGLARRIIAISGKSGLRATLVKHARNGEIRNRRPSLCRMNEALGFRASYGLEEGLRKTYEYFREFDTHSSGLVDAPYGDLLLKAAENLQASGVPE